MEQTKADGDASKKKGGSLPLRLAIAAVLAIGLILWVTLRDDDDSSASNSNGAEVVSVDSLRETAGEQDAPIYWAGEQEGAELELSQPDADHTYVRYLTDGAEAGDPQPDFLTVSTYSTADPVAALRRQGDEPGGVLSEAPGDATVYFNRSQPQSVYLAYPGVDVQIEVYDPDSKQALQLVNSGQIVAAG